MNTEMQTAGGKVKLKNGDAQLPEQNRRENLYGNAADGDYSMPSQEGEKFGKSGKDNFQIRQQNPNSY